MNARNILIVNSTGTDISLFDHEIAESLRRDGSLPEELADLFTVRAVEGVNPDGSVRYIIEAA